MANEEHLAILKQGVAAWNAWRNEHPDTVPDLGGVHLREANLGGADPAGRISARRSFSKALFSKSMHCDRLPLNQ
jgi:hypothetical protein